MNGDGASVAPSDDGLDDDAEEKLAKMMALVACSNACWNGAGIPLEMM
jgi:hypothetical protein